MSLTFLTDHTSPRMRALDERIVRGWNQRRPDRAVTLLVLDHEELRNRLERYLTDARPPDVMTWFAGNRMRSLVDRGLMLDVASLWDTAGLTESYDPRFRRMAGDNGAAFFLPTSHYWWAVYYRPSVFESLGVPAPIETWADLWTASEALKAAGIVPFALGARHLCPAAAWFDYLNLRVNGPRFHGDLMSLRESYTDDRVRAVFTFWQRLLNEGWFLGAPAEYDEEEAVDAVMRGAAGMTLIGSYVSDEYAAESEPDLDFFRFPVIDPALPVGEDAPVDGYFVAGNSTAPDEAAAFLAHLGSRDVQQQTIEVMNVLPTRNDVDINRGATHLAKGMNILRRADHLSQFYDLDTPWELADAGMQAFVSFLRDPARVDELLREVDSLHSELRDA
jgi:multiple sugar transport system substrate-binding protein/raffinose/stachyose/melibiose transport system substrate-binding protein